MMSLKDLFDLRTLEPVFPKSSQQVQQEMDHWADSFDTDAERTCYQAPTDVAHLARKTWEQLHPSSVDSSSTGSLELRDSDNSPKVLERVLKVYDFGCGTGLAGRYFIHRKEIVDGCDLSEKMLRQAKTRGYRHLQQLDLAQETPPREEPYDIAMSAGVIGEYLKPCEVIPKMAAVIQPRGVISFSADECRTTVENLLQVLINCGMKPVEVLLGKGYDGLRKEIKYYYVAAVFQSVGERPEGEVLLL